VLAGPGMASVSGRGHFVDVVWMTPTSETKGQLHYARSTDGGATFSARVLDPDLDISYLGMPLPLVARGPHKTGAVLWFEMPGNDFGRTARVRVSTDGGRNFSRPSTIASPDVTRAELAVGDGGVYVVYMRWPQSGRTFLWKIRRSVDNGASWTSPRTVIDGDDPSLVATGDDVYLAYRQFHDNNPVGLSVISSHNRAKSWSEPVVLEDRVELPHLSYDNGTLRLAYWSMPAGNISYRISVDAVHWTDPENVVRTGGLPLGVGFAGQPIVLYQAWDVTTNLYVKARRQ